MFSSTYLNKLKDKYNYDNKTINALAKIIPCFIEYYGDEYEHIILTAIHDCEIIWGGLCVKHGSFCIC